MELVKRKDIANKLTGYKSKFQNTGNKKPSLDTSTNSSKIQGRENSKLQQESHVFVAVKVDSGEASLVNYWRRVG